MSQGASQDKKSCPILVPDSSVRLLLTSGSAYTFLVLALSAPTMYLVCLIPTKRRLEVRRCHARTCCAQKLFLRGRVYLRGVFQVECHVADHSSAAHQTDTSGGGRVFYLLQIMVISKGQSFLPNLQVAMQRVRKRGHFLTGTSLQPKTEFVMRVTVFSR